MNTDEKTSDRIILFTRYPEPGKVKTRLIQALGVEGSVRLHRWMTENVLCRILELAAIRPVSVEIRYSGGTPALMKRWLGTDLVYRVQSSGDLGERMGSAINEAFAEGAERVRLVGSDLPGLSLEILREALDNLGRSDLTLGPATDGGYYLIGLNEPCPELFAGPMWGSAEVLDQTLEIARSLCLSVALLPYLDDVDRPEDLNILSLPSAAGRDSSVEES